MAELTDTDIRDRVRERYAAAASAVANQASSGCCCGEAGCGPRGAFSDPDMKLTDENGDEVWGHSLYGEEAAAAPKAALEASLGCGVPTAVADLEEGETVPTSAQAAERTCASRPAAWDRPGRRSGST